MSKRFLLLAGICAASFGVNAQAADLRVKGSIAPVSCSITVTNAVIDYGKIDKASLSATAYTKLGTKSTPFIVKCDSATRVGIKTVDNRSASKVPGMMVNQFGNTYGDIFNYGLGVTSKGEKIGGYVMHMRNTVADAKAVGTLGSNNNGVAWYASGGALGQSAHVSSWFSGALTPLNVKVVSGNLEFIAVINKTSALTLNSEVKLDGHSTLELRYL